MSPTTKPVWRLVGEEIGGCNCAWGCPCQFEAPPTYGRCEGAGIDIVHSGHYDGVSMNGVKFAWVLSWPGLIAEGNGTLLAILDVNATQEQRDILLRLMSGTEGGAVFEIFSSVCPNKLDPIVAPIEVETNRETRYARARIELPSGFEFKVAEMANSVKLKVTSGPLQMDYCNRYAQLNAFDWSNLKGA